ncbi:MAG: biopolymer transporter ExbD [Pirellulaceae bacterium]|nr:biopolymer transporter ExbD [Pirellulaceae bacterium]
MSKRKDLPPSRGDHMGGPSGEFDLGRPRDPSFQEMVAQPETASLALSGKIAEPVPHRPAGETEHKYKPMTWKGFEEEEPIESMPFGKRAPREEAEMDMTPMVDVTFLLLIFFMVTASFKLQKAIQQQPDLSDDPSNIVTEPKEQTDAIEIYIDENDNFTMTSSDASEEQAAGKVEMWQKLAKMKQDSQSVKRLLIKANENCSHGAVINAWDAGADAKIYEIAISVVSGP